MNDLTRDVELDLLNSAKAETDARFERLLAVVSQRHKAMLVRLLEALTKERGMSARRYASLERIAQHAEQLANIRDMMIQSLRLHVEHLETHQPPSKK